MQDNDFALSPQEQQIKTDLETALPRDLAVDFDSMFAKLKGFGVAKANKNRLELLDKNAPILRKAMQDGEVLRYITTGVVNLWWETLTIGAWAPYINRTAFVLTDKRILLIHMSGKNPESFVNQIPLSAIKKFSSSLFSSVLKLGKGSLNISGLKKADKKQLKALLPKKNKAAIGGIEHLCPKYFVMHAKHELRCSACGAEMKSPKTAAWRSALLPGLGDYYLGHHFVSSLEMISSVISWIVVLNVWISFANDGMPLVGFGVSVLIIAVANGSDAALTYAQGKKGMLASDGRLGSLTAR